MALSAAAKAKVNELTSFFSDALGSDAVLPSGETGRPYLKVAEINLQSGKVVLYANVAVETFPHKAMIKGEPRAVLALGAVVRFAQQGGLPDTFNPPLKPRKGIAGGFRLSKHAFPVCVAVGPSVKASWDEQNVTEKLVAWITGVALKAGAVPTKDALLKMVVEQALPSLAIPEGLDKLFTTDVETIQPGDFDAASAAKELDDEDLN